MSFSIVLDVVAALAVTALLTEAYGIVRRRLKGAAIAPVVLGVLFGIMALVQMYHPVEPFEGLILDLRNIPIALAGAFLGWRGLVPCLAIAMAVRVGIGGVGMESGLWGMGIAGLAGLFWARKRANIDPRSFPAFLLLGLMMSSHMLAAAALPPDLARWFITTAAAPMLVINMLAVPLIATLLERENHRIRRENRLAAAATRDAVSGLLLPAAFMRDMANAYTARPFGTFAGFLTIAPVPGIRRTATGLFGEPAPIALDRQALAMHLEHADLAGICVDGRLMVPLSPQELQKINRVKAELNDALRDTPSAASGAVVTLTVLEILDPMEFLRVTESAGVAANVDWKVESCGHQMSRMSPDRPSRVRRARIFNHDEHDILFAKVDFLLARRQNYAP